MPKPKSLILVPAFQLCRDIKQKLLTEKQTNHYLILRMRKGSFVYHIQLQHELPVKSGLVTQTACMKHLMDCLTTEVSSVLSADQTLSYVARDLSGNALNVWKGPDQTSSCSLTSVQGSFLPCSQTNSCALFHTMHLKMTPE